MLAINPRKLSRSLAVYILAALMLGLMGFFVATFFGWNSKPETLIRIHSVLGKFALWPFFGAIGILVIASIIRGRFVSWSATEAHPWVQKLFILASLLTVIMILGLGRGGSVRLEGGVTKEWDNGTWETVTPAVFERRVQKNIRRELFEADFGVLLLLGMASGRCRPNAESKYKI